MFTSLDLLVVVFMAVAALALLSLSLMFLLKNKIARRVCMYVVAALSMYMVYGGLAIGILGTFIIQIILAVIVALMTVGSIVLERLSKENNKMFLAARILAGAALILGIANAFLI